MSSHGRDRFSFFSEFHFFVIPVDFVNFLNLLVAFLLGGGNFLAELGVCPIKRSTIQGPCFLENAF